ncbi:MAG: hypothetical protein JKX70_03880 [Phycisphaerales bacterium]|nr:hypothetical protein [Phycisphaerales bacterium]
MKLKGVNPIEQHIEKIVLGVVMILLLAVLSMQFVSRPNDIKVSSTRSVSPDQVYTVLEGQAKQIQSQLSDLNPSLPEIQSVDLVERYNNAFANASGGTIELSSALGTGVDIANATSDIGTYIPPEGETGPIAALQVPMTSTPIAASMWATLDPYAVIQVPDYEEFVGLSQPFDFPSVSIEATFNGKDLEAALLGKGESGSVIPRRFWSIAGLAILGFESERQQLMPDGSWGNAQVVVTPPRTPTPTRALGEEPGLLDLTAVVTNAAGVIDEVARPMFPPTIAGEIWTPPSERVVTNNDSGSSLINRLTRTLERSRSELERLTNAPPPAGPKGGGGRGRNSPTTPTIPGGSGRNKAQIDRVEKKIKDLEEQLKDLGVDTTNSGTTTRRARTSAKDRVSILEQESIDLWTHDLGVMPGATYRYHTRVVVNNPLFRKSSELDADQQALTLDPFARGPWSAWSQPVVVGAKEYFFVTSAETAGGVGAKGAKATIELYKMFYGYYRKSTPSVSPGDELAATIRVSGDLLLFDTATLEVGDATKAVEELANADSSDLPDGITELSNRMTIDLGVYVLDIYTGTIQSETRLGQPVYPMQVVLRDGNGNVVVRSDLSDTNSSAFTLASESAAVASKNKLRAPGAPVVSPASELFDPPAP